MRRIVVCVAALLGVVLSPHAAAEDWPSRPIHFVVPFAPGGAIDLTARILGEKLGPLLGQSIIVENRSGAGALVGSTYVAKAKPDGYTFLVTDINHGTNPALYKSLPYDTVKDFTSVILIAELPAVLLVPADSKAGTVQELIALARSKPGALNYSSPGVGSINQLGAELFKKQLGLQIAHIPYQGGGPALTALVAGQVDMLIITLPPAQPFIKSGRLKALAVTSKARLPTLPDVPTMAEAGVPDFVLVGSIGLRAPAGTPKDIVDRLNVAMNKVLADPSVNGRITAAGGIVVGGSPEFFTQYLDDEIQRWRKTITPDMQID